MNKAFTLIELAIVIVVLGIMSAVIVGGKTIVDSANMNSTISQINQYRLAHNAFVLEYDAIPGDMKDANDYNLNLDSEGNNTLCYTRSDSDLGTWLQKGNGDKMLQSANNFIRFTGEIANYWIHLSNSGLIKEKIIGRPGNNCDYRRNVGINYPESAVGNSMIILTNYSLAFSIFRFIPVSNNNSAYCIS